MFETTLAGSLPRPDWLAEPETLKGAWKLSGQALEDGKRRAAAEWLRHEEEAGIDIVTNGEVFRSHFVHGFLEGLTGIDWQKMTRMGIRNNRYELEVPTVVAPLGRPAPVHLDEVRFSRAQTKTEVQVHPARPDDDLRHDRRWPLRQPAADGDGFRGNTQRRSTRTGRRRRGHHPVR